MRFKVAVYTLLSSTIPTLPIQHLYIINVASKPPKGGFRISNKEQGISNGEVMFNAQCSRINALQIINS